MSESDCHELDTPVFEERNAEQSAERKDDHPCCINIANQHRFDIRHHIRVRT